MEGYSHTATSAVLDTGGVLDAGDNLATELILGMKTAHKLDNVTSYIFNEFIFLLQLRGVGSSF